MINLRRSAWLVGALAWGGLPAAGAAPAAPDRNIARARQGGAIVRFTAHQTGVAQLIDGSADTAGWFTTNAHLPQDIVFAFRQDAEALVEKVVLNPKCKADRKAWPKQVSLALSRENPFDGFEEVGVFDLTQEPKDQELAVHRRARFVRLRVLETFGGKGVGLGEFKVMEGEAPGYVSVLTRPPSTAGKEGRAGDAATAFAEAEAEEEPNDEPSRANPLGWERARRGVIAPAADEDFFTFTVPGESPDVLSLALDGRPSIRTSLTLRAEERPVKSFDPGKAAGGHVDLSWRVTPGRHFLRVNEPPVSMVVIWDTSNSMQGRAGDLRVAVESFLAQVRPSERLKLIEFNRNIDSILPRFESDPAKLKAALKDKLKLGNGTAFFDAVARGVELLEGQQGNRVIVAMTDGSDTASQMAYPAFWDLLERKRIRLYTILLGGKLETFSDKMGTTPGRMLGHIALATHGRSFFTDKPGQLKKLYQSVTDEMRERSEYSVKAVLSRGAGALAVTATDARLGDVAPLPPLELIFDASGSMMKRIRGKRKIDVAKEVVIRTIDGLADNQRVALRIFGHRYDTDHPDARTDSELVFPLGPIDKAALKERIVSLKALGTTPVAYSLRQVPADLGEGPDEKRVILVSDGKEEAGGNPFQVVTNLMAEGVKMKLNIVGFALEDRATKQEMQRLAELTGGRFYDAADAEGLLEKVRESVEDLLAFPWELLDSAGEKVAEGMTSATDSAVPEGYYSVRVQAGDRPVTIPGVRVVSGGKTRVALRKEGDNVGFQVQGP